MLSILLVVPSCFNSFWHGVIPSLGNWHDICIVRVARYIPYRVSTRFYLGVHVVRNITTTVCGSLAWTANTRAFLRKARNDSPAPQPTKSTWAYTSAASCSACCTKAGSIQRTSYKRSESANYLKGKLELRHALATLQRREAYSSHFHVQLHASRLWPAFSPTSPWCGLRPSAHIDG